MSIVVEKPTCIPAGSITQIQSNHLSTLLDAFGPDIKVLSLDCFDTLVWRKSIYPNGVFFAAQKKPVFQSLNFTARLRMDCEGKARSLAILKNKKFDITLEEIYRAGFPALHSEIINKLAEEELATEMEYCYAMPPVVELISAAKKRGLKVIIVSDTYFSSTQLRRLLTHVLPDNSIHLLDAIFCSSEYGRAKSSGLFINVIQSLGVDAKSILHLGDNMDADVKAAHVSKLNAVHFLKFDPLIADQLRLHVTAAKILTAANGTEQPLLNPYCGILSLLPATPLGAEILLGYASLGPIMYAFAQFIQEEIYQQTQQNKNVKVAFLMRDGHLPLLACEAFSGHSIGKRIRISRFASYAASFRHQDDVLSYLVEIGETNRFESLAKQLLLPDNIAINIINAAKNSAAPYVEFVRLVQESQYLAIILENSLKYFNRLFKHLEQVLALKKGDTLMLVDLGYTGTTQRRLSHLFAEKGIEVIGRYLVVLSTPGWEKNRVGLLDPHCADEAMLRTLIYYILILEQLCTSNEKSVVDYDDHGNAIFTESGLSTPQHEKVEMIQAACVRFIHDAKQFFQKSRIKTPLDMLRKVAQAALGRLIFLPTQQELEFLKLFQGETNLGTQDILTLFDSQKGLAGLRSRGFFFMEPPSKDTRTNYPYELRTAGIEYVFSLIMQHQFLLDVNMKDMLLRREVVPVLFTRGHEHYETTTEAIATYDGYYALWLPGKLESRLQFGKLYQWLQIESADFIEMQAFAKQRETNSKINALPYLTFEGMSRKSEKLFECMGEHSYISLKPMVVADSMDYVLHLVWRPIEKRSL